MPKDLIKQRINQHKSYLKNKERVRKRTEKFRLEITLWLIEIKKNLKCIRCGESDWRCIDFHHRDPKDKYMTISRLIRVSASRSKILEEIKKCDPLCANCHRKEHYNKIGVFRIEPVTRIELIT